MSDKIDIFNEVCRDLPPHWTIAISLERHSG